MRSSSPSAPPTKLHLTYGEALRILRARKGETQAQAAVRLGVSDFAYRNFERSTEPAAGPDVENLGDITPGERYRVLRRRRGWGLVAFARKLDISRAWLIQMEQGRAPTKILAAYWDGAGATD